MPSHLSRVTLLLIAVGWATSLSAQQQRLPAKLQLREGQRIYAGKYLLRGQGTIVARVRSRNWDTSKLKTYALISVGTGENRIEVNAAGATLVASGVEQTIALPAFGQNEEHVVIVRWQNDRIGLWSDARLIGTLTGKFGAFSGIVSCPEPTKNDLPYRIVSFTCHRTAVSEASIAALSHSAGYTNEPLVTIPLISSSPSIDGILDPEEWATAAKLSGLHRASERVIARTQGDFYVSYTPENLYLAYQGPAPVELLGTPVTTNALAPLWYNEERHDGHVDDDDCVDIVIAPDFPAGERFRLVANHRGSLLDYRASRSVNLNWNPAWETASRYADESWFMEIRIPLKSFGRVPSEGDEWGMNLRRVWRMLQFGTDEWATGTLLPGGHEFKPAKQGESATLGRIRFGGASTVAARIDEVWGLHTTHPRLRLSVKNPTRQERQVRVRLQSNCGTVNITESLSVGPEAETPYEFKGEKLPPNSYLLTVTVDEAGSTAPLLKSSFFHLTQQPVKCEIRYYPSFDEVRLKWDLTDLRLSTKLTDIAAEVHLIDRKTNKIAFSHGVAQFTDFHHSESVDIRRLPPGHYVVAAIIGVSRKKAGQTVKIITKTTGQEWLGNSLGREEYVPYPFLPIRSKGFGAVSGRQIEVINRVYDFGRVALPEQIYIMGEPILSGPIRLIAIRHTGKVRDLARDIVWGKGSGNPIVFDYFSRRSDRVKWNSTSGREDSVAPSINGWAEYDGMMWFNVRVRGGKWPELKSLKLQIPIKKKWSTLVNSYGDHVGDLPPKGFTKYWQPVWLGNEKGGLQWVSETASSWLLDRPEHAIRVTPRLDDTLLEITFVDHDVDLPRGFKTEFGLIATPVRPAKDWNFTGRSPLGDDWTIGNYSPKETDTHNPMAWPNGSYGRQIRNAGTEDEEGIEIAPRIRLDQCSAGASTSGQQMIALLDHYYHEWAAHSMSTWKPGVKTLEVSPTSQTWQDFLVWTCSNMHETTRYTGYFVEGVTPPFCDNRDAGSGFLLDRVVYPRWSLLGTRQLLKRLYEMLRKREPYGSIRMKIDGPMLAPLIGFCETVTAGDVLERKFSTQQPNAYQHLTLDAYRAQFLGTNFGPYCWWRPPNTLAFKGELAEGKAISDLYADVDRESRWLAGIALVHHSPVWQDLIPGNWSGIRKAVDDYGIDQANWFFKGYWEKPPVKLHKEQDGLVVSAYVVEDREAAISDHRALLVIFNNSDWTGEVTLTPDWKVLKLDAGSIVENALTGEKITSNGPITISVKARDVTLVGLRDRQND